MPARIRLVRSVELILKYRKDTTLQDRSSTPRRSSQSTPSAVSRFFAIGTIELDDLVEAIRQLLGSEIEVADSLPATDLLFVRHRGMHVVGSTKAEVRGS
jgi:hypothetical protein